RSDRQRLRAELRDLRWNPQRHLEGALREDIAEALEQRRALLAWQPPDRQGRWQRFRALRANLKVLRSAVKGREEELRRGREKLDLLLVGDAVLRRRDYSFCLFPEELLRPFCSQFSQAN